MNLQKLKKKHKEMGEEIEKLEAKEIQYDKVEKWTPINTIVEVSDDEVFSCSELFHFSHIDSVNGLFYCYNDGLHRENSDGVSSWNYARIPKQLTSDDYLKLHKASGFKVGDKVRVLRKAENHENGWEFCCAEGMDCYIGNEYMITGDDAKRGFCLNFFDFPYFVLCKVD